MLELLSKLVGSVFIEEMHVVSGVGGAHGDLTDLNRGESGGFQRLKRSEHFRLSCECVQER